RIRRKLRTSASEQRHADTAWDQSTYLYVASCDDFPFARFWDLPVSESNTGPAPRTSTRRMVSRAVLAKATASGQTWHVICVTASLFSLLTLTPSPFMPRAVGWQTDHG